MIDLKKILACALVGLMSAVMADLDAWKDGRDPDGELPGFDWNKAFRRYLKGITTGIVGALGWSQL